MGIANGSSPDTLFRGYSKLAKSNYVMTMPSQNSAMFYNTLRHAGINTNALVRDIQDYSGGINTDLSGPTMTMSQEDINNQALQRIAIDAQDRDAMVVDTSKELLPETPEARPSRDSGRGRNLRAELRDNLQATVISSPRIFGSQASKNITLRSQVPPPAPSSPFQKIRSYVAGDDLTPKSKTP